MTVPEKKMRYLYDDEIGRVDYVQHMGDELTIVNAARVSFGKHKEDGFLDERDQKLLLYLMENQHTSVLEHNVITFRVKVPLFVRGQHHRHRTWSYNEISRRYTDFELEFYCPKAFRKQHKSNRQASDEESGWFDPVLLIPGMDLVDVDMASSSIRDMASSSIREHTERSLLLFEALLNAGVAREMARMVLPQNMYVQYYATVNLNNFIKFLDLRLEPHAQWEIRRLAWGMLELVAEIWPQVIGPMLIKKFKNWDAFLL